MLVAVISITNGNPNLRTISFDISNLKNEINRQQAEEAAHAKALEDAEYFSKQMYRFSLWIHLYL